MTASRGVLPPNFSWVVDGLLAVMAYPSAPEHFSYLQNEGISILVSLTEQPPKLPSNTELDIVHIPIVDFTAPKISQVEEFINCVDNAQIKKQTVAVHCHMGRGRTGTLTACYLMHSMGMSATQAISQIRTMRPGSIETVTQEQLIREYEEQCKL